MRFLPEELISYWIEGDKFIESYEVVSTVFVQAFAPTSYWEPHPLWNRGQEGRRSVKDIKREESGEWSKDKDYAEPPSIPTDPIKHWREPCDSGHTDGVTDRDGNNMFMGFKQEERVTYDQDESVGTIIGPANPLLSSWYITPEHSQMERITVPTADIHRLRHDNVPRAWCEKITPIESVNTGEETADEQADSTRDDSSPCAPDGDALSKLMAKRSRADDCPMCVAKEDDLNVRLVHPRLDSKTFEEIVATMKTVGVDPEKIIAERDPDMVSRAAEYGCELKHIRLAIEYVNAKIFNDKMYKRNRRFERDSPDRVTRSWIKEWLSNHPNHTDEINWQSHTVESRHAHFKTW